MLDTFTAAKLFQLGMFEEIGKLDIGTQHKIAVLVAKVLTEERDTLIPVCYGQHFYLVKITVQNDKRCFELFDSMQGNSTNLTANCLYGKFCSQIKKNHELTGITLKKPSGWTVRDKKCCQQNDGYNCGIYIIHFAENVIKDKQTYFFNYSILRFLYCRVQHFQQTNKCR